MQTEENTILNVMREVKELWRYKVISFSTMNKVIISCREKNVQQDILEFSKNMKQSDVVDLLIAANK